MQRNHRPVPAPHVPVVGRASGRPAADVPSDELWHDAIEAARLASQQAAELRRALQASQASARLPHA